MLSKGKGIRWAALAVWVYCGGACAEKKAPHQEPENSARGAAVSELSDTVRKLVGVSDDPAGVVWFLRLNSGRGGLYDGTQWTAICAWQQGADGRFAFTSAARSGRTYKYDGRAVGDSIRGSLNAESRSNPHAYGAVVFRPIDRWSSVRPFPESAGAYSDIKYNESAGDVVGSEMVIGSVAGKPAITLTLEGGSMGPFLAREIDQSQDTLRFRVGDSDGPETRWRAVFRRSEVALWYGAAAPRRDGGPTYVLPRTQDLSSFFAQEAGGVCPNN